MQWFRVDNLVVVDSGKEKGILQAVAGIINTGGILQ